MAETGDVTAPFPGFTAAENQGKALFLGRAGCAACHLANGRPGPGPRPNQAIFFVNGPANNGLDAELVGADDGVGDMTGDSRDNGLFKSPSLRNIALSAPYMHDGRFATLAEVVEHYNSGVQAHPNLDPRLRIQGSNQPHRLNLSNAESAALVAFLETLNDDALDQDIKYADPFLPAAP